jgi:energy-coupling factor transporter ATP-binding protein EcfA2
MDADRYDSDEGVLSVADIAERCGRTTPAGGRVVVLIDGRSGTGKTTLANALAPLLDAQLVHLDDIYPGWDGLRAAADAVAADVLAAPTSETAPDGRAAPDGPAAPDGGTRPGWRRWDWGTSLPAGWNRVDPERAIVVEGCGALSRASARLATFRIWMESEDDTRRERAIARDGDTFAREWDRWARQEDAFIAAEQPETLTDLRIALRS